VIHYEPTDADKGLKCDKPYRAALTAFSTLSELDTQMTWESAPQGYLLRFYVLCGVSGGMDFVMAAGA